MSALHAEHVLMNVLWMQFQKVTSIQLMLTFAPIVAHVLKFARLTQFLLPNKNGQHKIYYPVLKNTGFFYALTEGDVKFWKFKSHISVAFKLPFESLFIRKNKPDQRCHTR